MVQRTLETAPKKGTSATMKAALVASVAAHVGIFGYAFFGWASPDAAEVPVVENVSVDIIEVTETTQITPGDETGEADAPQAIRTVEAEATADTAQDGEMRDAPAREVAIEPRPAPAPAPQVREIAIAPAPPPEPEPAAEPLPQVVETRSETPIATPAPEVETAAAPPPAPRGRPAGLRAPAPEPVVEPTPQVAAVAPQPETAAPSVVEPVPQAEPRPEPQVTLVQPIAPPPAAAPAPDAPLVLNAPTAPGVSEDALLDTLDPDRIAALLNKVEPVAAAPEPTQQVASATPSLGATDGADATLTISEIGALRRQLAQCWTPPLGARGAETLTVKVSMDLNQDGTVRGMPRVVDAPFGPAADAAAGAATRAVLNCQPYALPAEKYDLWQNITINFDPRQMLGL